MLGRTLALMIASFMLLALAGQPSAMAIGPENVPAVSFTLRAIESVDLVCPPPMVEHAVQGPVVDAIPPVPLDPDALYSVVTNFNE